MKKLSEYPVYGRQAKHRGKDVSFTSTQVGGYKIPAPVAAAADAVIRAAIVFERNCGEWFNEDVCPDCKENYLCRAVASITALERDPNA